MVGITRSKEILCFSFVLVIFRVNLKNGPCGSGPTSRIMRSFKHSICHIQTTQVESCVEHGLSGWPRMAQSFGATTLLYRAVPLAYLHSWCHWPRLCVANFFDRRQGQQEDPCHWGSWMVFADKLRVFLLSLLTMFFLSVRFSFDI